MPEAFTVCFYSFFFYFFFECMCLRLYPSLYIKKYIPAFILCCFSDWKICIWRSSLSLCSKEQTWWLFVLLLALEYRLLPHLLINLQFCFLSSMGEVRDSSRWSPWRSRGGQPPQRDSELSVFKKRTMARQVPVSTPGLCAGHCIMLNVGRWIHPRILQHLSLRLLRLSKAWVRSPRSPRRQGMEWGLCWVLLRHLFRSSFISATVSVLHRSRATSRWHRLMAPPSGFVLSIFPSAYRPLCSWTVLPVQPGREAVANLWPSGMEPVHKWISPGGRSQSWFHVASWIVFLVIVAEAKSVSGLALALPFFPPLSSYFSYLIPDHISQ